MTDKVIENNQVLVIGKIISDFTYSHEIFGEGFYMAEAEVTRLSDSCDVIPLMVSVLSVFVRELEFLDEEEYEQYAGENSRTNQIFLDGYICKEPVYRKTPLGREIADLLLAVNRPYGKSDYIPCICWGRNARYASTFQVGARCEVWGRIQSREYMKKLSEEEVEKRVAYEVSVSKLEIMEDE